MSLITMMRGKHVILRPATPADRCAIWEWATCSDLTASMMGPPEFAENPISTWEEFQADYLPFFFDGSRPEVGRSFVIEHEGRQVGHISYSRLDERSSALFAELDIWMRDSSCCGHGWGSDALRALSDHLRTTFGVRELILRPSARNTRAVRSYEKAGFRRSSLADHELAARYGPDEYHDTVVLVKFWPREADAKLPSDVQAPRAV